MKFFIITLFTLIAIRSIGQSPSPVVAVVNQNGTINLISQNVTVISECYDYLDLGFVNTVFLVECTHLVNKYIIMTDDLGRLYYFDLPYQLDSYFSQWCGSGNMAAFYQSIKSDLIWLHPNYRIQCEFVRSNGDQCSRYSNHNFCWQHR